MKTVTGYLSHNSFLPQLFVVIIVSLLSSSVSSLTVVDPPANTIENHEVTDVGRGHMKNMMMNPYMLIPQLIALGFAPIVLVNLKMMIMNAMMINNMALNAAAFMLIRNIVFGRRPGPTVKYVNYGYKNKHQPHRRRKAEEVKIS
ncbi:uncharacterized protein LOC126893817 [Daktulosphaira vitifoliae]|uniref:uncharacterized protein LOC126893817 n=1 Tax=Daktulosphaira vitifoliae TaxID=58002 RepID=UPI0021AA8DBD|nr:uncharacterized protein LOC126893817 [Daktulosphaira vitifoliae]